MLANPEDRGATVHATTTAGPRAGTLPAARPGAQPWSTLVVLCATQFMVVLDITVVNVALPSIGADLRFAAGDLQWVVTAYVLFAGGLLLLGGRAADLLGRRRVFLAGLLLFTIASLASALAWSPVALIVARAAQGLGAALLTPAALSIIVTTYSGAQHATALTAWGVIASAGAAAGMLLGGILTSWMRWEWIFLINVPVGLAAAALAMRLVSPARPPGAVAGQLDLPGAALVVGGLVVLVYAIQGTAEHGWGSTHTLVLLGVGSALIAGFVGAERTVERPLLSPATWRSRSLVAGAAILLGATGILVGAFFLNSLYLQHVIGASALETGLGFLPIAVAIAIAAHLASHLMGHAGSRLVAVVGASLMAAATALLAAVPDEASYAGGLLPGFLILGFGVGLVFPAASVTAMSELDHDGAGIASGLMMTAHEIGAALGVAALSAIAAAAPAADFAAGYRDGLLAAALIAAALAVVALLTLPAVRPSGAARHAMH
ncbi:MAG: MFS transporter [Actinobacteria bacterium]|nr:MFS transporter [Actinomycetota bacterium]